MSTSVQDKTVPKVRTYAADLNSARLKTGAAPVAQTEPPVAASKKPEPVIKEKGEAINPPFHAFSNANKSTAAAAPTPTIKTVNNSQAETQKILSRSSAVSEVSGAKENLPAVIITDTKRNRFKLGSAMMLSISQWWNNKKAEASKKKIPKYTVVQPERRKGVIQKATTKTGRASTADHSSVVSNIKATKQAGPLPRTPYPTAAVNKITPPEKIILKNPLVEQRPVSSVTTHVADEVTKAPTWESDIQSQVNSLNEEKPDSKIILTGKEFSKIKQQRAAAEAPRVIAPVIPIVPKVPTPPPTTIIPEPETIITAVVPPVVKNEETKTAPASPTPIARPKITPTIPKPPVVVTQEVAPPKPVVAPEIIEPIPEPTKRPEPRFAPPREEKRSIFATLAQTNSVVFISFGVLLLVVASGLGLRSYLMTPTETIPEIEMPVENSIFIDTSARTQTNFVSSVDDIKNALQAQTSQEDSLLELNLVNQAGVTLTPTEVLSLLNAEVLFDFKATVSTIVVGNYRGNPYVVLSIYDKNTALGGMLEWENRIAADLSQILSPNTTVLRKPFVDEIVGTLDVRVLKDEAGTENIMYGFLDTNTILITTNTTAFINLAAKIK